ncbi:DUF6090 family protein [Robiginitalea sp. IMCC44478]|uniref:DUF6090 family protein n=1 Tax=Robiginitalea sp. IMCC44478 TaxID=3459122 RepID=UPI0040424054
MIRFFRQIRQRLLTDNKISKYLLYAVGEILLVMIGILLALQVNNWNEDRKRKKDKIELVNTLTQHFKSQIEFLEASIRTGEDEVKKLNSAIKMIEAQNITIPIDSVKQHISRTFYQTGIFLPFQKVEMAINSGRIDLIEDDNFDNNIANLLYRNRILEKLYDEHLRMVFSGPLSEIKEENWEVYKPFEDRLNGFAQNNKDYLDYMARPDVMARIKNEYILKENIIRNMNRILDAAKNIVLNLESQNE